MLCTSRRELIAALLAVIVATAGCGGSDGDAPTPPANGNPNAGGPNNNATFRVMSTTPDEDELAVNPESTVTIKFSLPLDSTTTTPNNIRVVHSITRHPVDGTFDFPDTQTVVFKPVFPFEYGVHYEGLVRHYVTSTSGTHLQGSYKWEFMIDDAPSSLSLHVSPEDGKLDVNLRSLVRVDFNSGIDASTVNTQSFTLSDSAGAAVAATVEYDPENHSAALRPTSPLAAGTSYTAQLSDAIKRSLGQAITPLSWTFTTASAATQTVQLGGSSEDQFSPLLIDAQGNRIVSRTIVGVGNPSPQPGPVSASVMVEKYSAQGSLLWSQDISGGADVFSARLAIDSQGSVIVAATSVAAPAPPLTLGGTDIIVLKLNATDGAVQWRSTFGTPNDDVLPGLAVDSANDIYVSAMTFATATDPRAPINEDGLVIKISGAGTGQIWQTKFGSAATDVPTGVAVDETGTVFVTGSTAGTLDNQPNAGQFDVFVSRFNATDGAPRGSVVTGTADADQVHALAQGPNGLYLIGDVLIDNPQGVSDIEGRVWAFNAAGTQVAWTQTIGGTRLESIHFGAVGPAGNLFVAGYMDTNFFGPVPPPPSGPSFGVEPPLFVAALNASANGNVLWKTELRAAEEAGLDHLFGGHAEASGLAVNSANEPTLLATVHGPGGFDGLTSAGHGDGFLLTLDGATGKLR